MRKPRTVYRYPRDEIRTVIETEGKEAALARWPAEVVLPIARLLGAHARYRDTTPAWKPEWNALLGTKPDGDLSAELGVSVGQVSKIRRLLDIPNKPAWEYIHEQYAAVTNEIPDDDLTALSVESLRVKYRVTASAVKAERARRGVKVRRGGTATFAQVEHGHLLRSAVAGLISGGLPDRSRSPCTLAVCGLFLGLSRERVRQVAEEARGMLDAALQEKQEPAETQGEMTRGTKIDGRSAS